MKFIKTFQEFSKVYDHRLLRIKKIKKIKSKIKLVDTFLIVSNQD